MICASDTAGRRSDAKPEHVSQVPLWTMCTVCYRGGCHRRWLSQFLEDMKLDTGDNDEEAPAN